VHAGCIDDQLLRNIHPSPGVDGDRRVGKVNQQCHDGSLETSHRSEYLVGDQHRLQGAPLDDGLPLQSRQGLEHFVVGRGRDLLRGQIQPLVIAVHRQPRSVPAGETCAGAVVPLERRPLRISRFQVVPARGQGKTAIKRTFVNPDGCVGTVAELRRGRRCSRHRRRDKHVCEFHVRRATIARYAMRSRSRIYLSHSTCRVQRCIQRDPRSPRT